MENQNSKVLISSQEELPQKRLLDQDGTAGLSVAQQEDLETEKRLKKNDSATKALVVYNAIVGLEAKFSNTAEEQQLLGQLTAATLPPTIGQLVLDYPISFGQCFNDAEMLVKAATARGKAAMCITTGFKGFRILITDPVMDGSSASDLVEPVLAAFFGLSHGNLPSTIDYSPWDEESKDPHPATGLWPAHVDFSNDALDQQLYGLNRPDPVVMDAIAQFCSQGLDRTEKKKKKKAALPKKRGRPKKPSQQGDHVAAVLHDDFSDIVVLLATNGWVAQHSSMQQLVKGERYARVHIDRGKSAPRPTECTMSAHLSSQWTVSLVA